MPYSRTRFRASLGAAASFLTLALAACDASTTGLDFPSEAVQVQAPARYAVWWRAIEQCSGRRADFHAVRWFVTEHAIEDAERGGSYAGYYYADGNRVVLHASGPTAVTPDIVRHEMLHAILGRTATEPHPPEMFRDRCAGLVACTDFCGADPNAAPNDSSPMVSAAALERSLWISSEHVSTDTDSGWVSMVVRARNPYPYPIWVNAVPSAAGARPAALFAVAIDGAVGEVLQQGARRVAFGPYQTRAILFDRQAPGPRALPAGVHRVRAAVLGDSTEAATLEVR